MERATRAIVHALRRDQTSTGNANRCRWCLRLAHQGLEETR